MKGLVERGQSRAFQGLVHMASPFLSLSRRLSRRGLGIAESLGEDGRGEPFFLSPRPACGESIGRLRRPFYEDDSARSAAGEGALHESEPHGFGTRSPFAVNLARAKAFGTISAHLTVTKTKKAPPTPFPKRIGIGTHTPRPLPLRLAGCLLRKPLGRWDRRGGQPWLYSLPPAFS